MKKVLKIVIPLILVALCLVGYYKFIYVPAGETFRIKYENLKRDYKGQVKEVKTGFVKNGFHTRVVFQKVGELIDYTFDVTNDGTIPAKLAMNPIYFGKDNWFKKYMFATFTYADDTEVKKGDVINPGETKTFKYHISYYEEGDMADKEGFHFETTVFLLYVQNR